jgi:hypothetical protein
MAVDTIIQGLVASLVAPQALIFAEQNAPRPATPYWTLKITTVKALGSDSYGQGVNNDGDQLVKGVREATVRIQRLGPDAVEACLNLRNALSKTTVREIWQSQKLALYRFGDILDTSYKLEDSLYEVRAGFDLFVRFGTELLDRVGIIEQVNVDAEYVTNQGHGFDDTNPDLGETVQVVL